MVVLLYFYDGFLLQVRKLSGVESLVIDIVAALQCDSMTHQFDILFYIKRDLNYK